MFCRFCGKEIDDEAVICVHCGEKTANYREIVSSTRELKKPKRITAALLALFLGSFGVHKFYLGCVELGFLYLCFFWTGFPLLVSIAESILYFVCPDDEFLSRYGYQDKVRTERKSLFGGKRNGTTK